MVEVEVEIVEENVQVQTVEGSVEAWEVQRKDVLFFLFEVVIQHRWQCITISTSLQPGSCQQVVQRRWRATLVHTLFGTRRRRNRGHPKYCKKVLGSGMRRKYRERTLELWLEQTRCG